jgi:hypothetical protein
LLSLSRKKLQILRLSERNKLSQLDLSMIYAGNVELFGRAAAWEPDETNASLLIDFRNYNIAVGTGGGKVDTVGGTANTVNWSLMVRFLVNDATVCWGKEKRESFEQAAVAGIDLA